MLTVVKADGSPGNGSLIDEIVREGARRMLAAALEAGVDSYLYLAELADARDEAGGRLVVRNGFHQPRQIATSAGSVEVKAPRVNDKRVDETTGERHRFSSAILPPWARKTPRVCEVLPLLCLHGLSTGDFVPALEQFTGSTAGLSSARLSRLTAQWTDDHKAFQKRDPSKTDFVHVRADDVHLKARLDQAKACVLAMVGVRADGSKEPVALQEGYRESSKSRANLMRDCARRGMRAPVLAVGDGAPGSWKALREVVPETAEQRCSVHKTIKAAHIRAWVAELSTRLAPSTMHKSLTILRDILGTAAADRLIPRSPASRQDRISAPQIPETKRIPWTKEQATGVRDALPDFYRILIPLGIGLGLRQGEVFGLSMDNFNDDGTVSIRRQLCDANGKRSFALPKGGKTRTIRAPRSLRELVKKHAEDHPPVEVKLPWATPDGRPTTVRALISTKRRCPVAVNYFNASVWKPALAQAGVINSETRRRASGGKLYSPAPENGFHVLRHTYASIMLQAGEPVHAVAKWLGHSDPAITLRVYAHLMPEAGERGISTLDDEWL